MRYYCLVKRDQPKPSWVLTLPAKPQVKPAKGTGLPPALNRFLGYFANHGREMKAQYDSVRCHRCGRYSDDDVFKVGFFDPFFINVKGDFDFTGDRVPIINDKFVKVLQKEKVRGYETKKLGRTGWHALKATTRVKFSPKIMKPSGKVCPECKRSRDMSGRFHNQCDVAVPNGAKTIFTTERGWHSTLWDRDIFMTEDVVLALKAAGIKGGYGRRLLTEEDLAKAKELAKEGKRLKPTEITIPF
jgi:hypothetical protein